MEHSKKSKSTPPLGSTPAISLHHVWESSTPQIPEVQLPVPHRPNEQAAAQFSPPNFSHFHAGPACKLSSPFLFPSLLPCVPARRPAPACPLSRAEATTGVPPHGALRGGGGEAQGRGGEAAVVASAAVPLARAARRAGRGRVWAWRRELPDPAGRHEHLDWGSGKGEMPREEGRNRRASSTAAAPARRESSSAAAGR